MINDVIYYESNELIDVRGSFIKIFSTTWGGFDPIQLEESFITRSIKGSTRGMHIQIKPTENWKIITVVEGHIFDVLVDLRKSSKTYLEINQKYIKSGGGILLPPGIAHGFQAIENSMLIYCSSRAREAQFDLGFNVQSLLVDWPLDFGIQSERDKNLPSMVDFLYKH